MSRKLANDDVLDFTFKAQIPIVSPFTTGTNTPTNTRTIRSPDSEQAQVICYNMYIKSSSVYLL